MKLKVEPLDPDMLQYDAVVSATAVLECFSGVSVIAVWVILQCERHCYMNVNAMVRVIAV